MSVLLPLLIFGLFYLTYNTMENNYSVYQHVTPDNMYYFGATQNVERRWRKNGAEYKRTALQPYIEKYGWDNIQHIVLFREQTRENALWIEDFLITTAQEDGVCINKKRSGLISKEEGYNQDRNQKYYEQNKDRIRERHREYRDEHKDKIRKYHEQYYQKNREKELEQRQQRYQKNREKELEQSRQRYQKNREKILEQSRQRYQRKKQEKQFKEFGCLPLW